MSQAPRHEKQNEKEDEKRREKDEKRWDEKWRRDPLNIGSWAIILIWAGVVLLLDNLGVFEGHPSLQGWAVFFLGAGAILLVQALIRLAMPEHRRPIGGTFILGVIFLAIGLGDIAGWELVWPIAIIAIGMSMLLSRLWYRRR